MTRILDAATIETTVAQLQHPEPLFLEGFLRQSEIAEPALKTRAPLPGPGTATTLMPGLLPGIPAYTVKVNAKFPLARPAIRGVVCLHSLADGELLALLDSATITAWRTGLAAAIVTDALATASARTLGVVGAGAQARIVLSALARRRALELVVVHDIVPRATQSLLAGARALGLRAQAAASPREVAERAEIVVVATWSESPLLGARDLRPGHQVTSLGMDEPGKRELARDALASAVLVVDDRELAVHSGVAGSSGIRSEQIAATAAEILSARHPGRSSDDDVIVYAPVGMPWQDLALSWAVFERARQDDLGLTVDLLGHAPWLGSAASRRPSGERDEPSAPV